MISLNFYKACLTTLVLACTVAHADPSNGDMSDRGGDSFELLSGQSWGRLDRSDEEMLEHFFGPCWVGAIRGNGCLEKRLDLPTPTAPIPEPGTWALLVIGLAALLLRRRVWK